VKKITIVFLTAVYLFSALGVSANSFYCCGVLKSASFAFGPEKYAYCKMAPAADGCCQTKTRLIKVKDNHYSSGSLSIAPTFFAVIVPFISSKVNNELHAVTYTAFNSHAPPNRLFEPIYTLNCTYRI